MIEAHYRIPSHVPHPRTPRPVSSDDKGACIAQPVEKPDLDAQAAGIELRWTTDHTLTVNPDMTVEVEQRGKRQTDTLVVPHESDYYVVLTGQQILLPQGFNGLILPHPRFFDPVPAGAFSDIPHVVPRAFALDQWPRPISLLCVRPRPGTQHIFYAGEPYCQVIPIPRGDVAFQQINGSEAEMWKARELFTLSRDQQLGGYEGFLKQLRRLGWAGLAEAYPKPDSEALK